MGKKIDIVKPAVEARERAEPVETPPPVNGSIAATPKKKPARGAAAVKKKAPARKSVTLSTGDIALKAYFIAEHRQRHGLPGNEHTDWIEAERQLHAEAREKATAAAKVKSKTAKAKEG